MQSKKKLNNVYLNDIYISFYHVLQIQNIKVKSVNHQEDKVITLKMVATFPSPECC